MKLRIKAQVKKADEYYPAPHYRMTSPEAGPGKWLVLVETAENGGTVKGYYVFDTEKEAQQCGDAIGEIQRTFKNEDVETEVLSYEDYLSGYCENGIAVAPAMRLRNRQAQTKTKADHGTRYAEREDKAVVKAAGGYVGDMYFEDEEEFVEATKIWNGVRRDAWDEAKARGASEAEARQEADKAGNEALKERLCRPESKKKKAMRPGPQHNPWPTEKVSFDEDLNTLLELGNAPRAVGPDMAKKLLLLRQQIIDKNRVEAKKTYETMNNSALVAPQLLAYIYHGTRYAY